MKKGGVKTSEDGETINDCFLLNEQNTKGYFGGKNNGKFIFTAH